VTGERARWWRRDYDKQADHEKLQGACSSRARAARAVRTLALPTADNMLTPPVTRPSGATLYRDADTKCARSGTAMTMARILIGLLMLSAPAEASTIRKLECQEWVEGKYQGVYVLNFNEDTNRLTVKTVPDSKNEKGMPFARIWRVLWSNEDRVIASSVDDKDWGGPVHVMFLNFPKTSMSLHIPKQTEGVYQVNTRAPGERKCRRLD
jgi:hypothetical protein